MKEKNRQKYLSCILVCDFDETTSQHRIETIQEVIKNNDGTFLI